MKKVFLNIKNLIFLIRPYWKYGKIYIMGLMFFSVILTPIKSTVSILFTQTIIDAVGDGIPFKNILLIIFYFLSFNGVTLVFNQLFDSLYAEKKLIEINQKINLEIYNKIIVTDYKYFDDPTFYDSYTWSANEYTTKSREAVTLLNNVFQALMTIISMMTFIAILGPWIIMISVVQITVSTLIEMKRNKINIKKQEENIPFDRKIGYVHRIICQKEYAADIKATNLKDFLFEMYNDSGKKKLLLVKKYAIILLFWIFSQNFINVLYDASIFAYISYCIVVSGKITGVGKFMGLLSANSQLVTSLYSFYSVISQSSNLSLYAENIRRFLQTKSYIEEGSTKIKEVLSDKAFSLELNHVSFSYPNSGFCLNDINMKIKRGERIAIVGENGVGKTTLVKLLLRLYDVDNGKILIDGKQLKEYNIQELRNHIGVAFQTPNLYAIPFIDNISLYREADEKKINEIIDQMKFGSVFIKNGATLYTEMTKEFTKNGIILSGGENQKMGIARLLTGDFGMLIFDEPSSALDPIAEYELMKLIYDSSNKTTSIIIAHRLSTVRNADRIYVMKDGTVIESGTHNQLMDLKGQYYDMFSKQAENYIK